MRGHKITPIEDAEGRYAREDVYGMKKKTEEEEKCEKSV